MTQPPSPRVQAMLALRLVQGVGPRTLSALLDHFPDPQVVFDPRTSLEGVPGVSPAILDRIRLAARSTALGQELEALARGNATLLARGEAGYPEQLVSLPGMPPLLYLVGDYLPADRRAVGLVGSRDATPYGRRMAQRLATGLARAGYTVISGLARGIDGVAHEAALEAGGRTLAVLANGLSGIYPPEHADLAVLISSPHAYIPMPSCMAYNMAKAGLDMMGKTAAMELAPHQIRVNMIYPGWTDTPGERKFFTEQTLAHASRELPQGRLMKPEEVARGVVFLCDDASDCITGTILSVDGGSQLPWWSKRGTGDF